MTKLLSKLTKSDILSLPGFDQYESLKIRELKPLLKNRINQMNIDFRGIRVDDYVNRFNEIKREQKQSVQGPKFQQERCSKRLLSI